MPLYDYYCEKCEKVMEDVVCKVNKEAHCKECGEIMTRMVNCKTFKLLYDPKKDTVGWSFNGYERSQYWDQVKKQKESN